MAIRDSHNLVPGTAQTKLFLFVSERLLLLPLLLFASGRCVGLDVVLKSMLFEYCRLLVNRSNGDGRC